MGRLTGGGDVAITIGTRYINTGVQLAKQGISSLNPALGTMRDNISRTTHSIFNLRNAIIGTGLVYAIDRLGGSLLNSSAQFEGFKTQLETITGSAVRAQKMFQETVDFAARTPFEVAELVEVRALLESVGVVGLDALTSVGNAAASMNRSIIDTGAALVSMEKEVLQRYGIMLKREADSATFTWRAADGARRNITVANNDEILRSTLIAIWNERYAGGMERFTSTWKGMTSNLADHWTQFMVKVGDAGLFDYMKGGVSLVLEEIDNLKKDGTLDDWAQQTSDNIIYVFETTALGVASIADTAIPVARGIWNDGILPVWQAVEGLPTVIKEIGVIGYFALGTKGKAVLLGSLWLMGVLETAMERSSESAKKFSSVTGTDVRTGMESAHKPVAEFNRTIESLATNLDQVPADMQKFFRDQMQGSKINLSDMLGGPKKDDPLGLVGLPDPDSYRGRAQSLLDAMKEKAEAFKAAREAMLGGKDTGGNGGGGGDSDIQVNPFAGRFDEHLDNYREFWAKQAELEDAEWEAKLERLGGYKSREAEMIEFYNKEIIRGDQVRANITGKTYEAVQDQMLSFIETGKFSVGEMAKIVAQQIKIELTGIAARAAVWAIFHTAMGIGRAAFGDAQGASLHFASAAQFAATAGMALAGAAAVHGMFGGTATRPEPGTTGGEPIRTQPASYSGGAPSQAPATPSITVQIYNPMSNEDWDKLAEEDIVPAIRRATGRNVSI